MRLFIITQPPPRPPLRNTAPKPQHALFPLLHHKRHLKVLLVIVDLVIREPTQSLDDRSVNPALSGILLPQLTRDSGGTSLV